MQSRDALDVLILHATLVDDDDINPTMAQLISSADVGLVPRLHEALDRFLDERNFYGRDLIASVLAGIQGVAALPALLRAMARDLGDDQDSLVGYIDQLMKADRAAARSAVLEFATEDAPELRRIGLWALGSVAEAQDLDLLVAAASDADPGIRSIAIGAFPNLAGDDRLFGLVVGASQDPVERVRVAAVSRLGFSGRADAVAPLVSLAADPAVGIRSMVAFSLGRLGQVEGTEALLRLLQDPERQVRGRAAEGLGSVGGATAVDALLALAAEDEPQSRVDAAKALIELIDTDARVWPQLVMLTRDEEAAVRAATLSWTHRGRGEDSDRAQFLIDLAHDPDPAVRRRVAVTARDLAPDAARDILHQYADDGDQDVRRLARAELGRLTGPTSH